MRIRNNDSARFMSKTCKVGTCIEWTGALNKDGYGKFMVGPHGKQRTFNAHRWAYEQHHGSVPPLLRHKCDNPRCVNVDHLEPGTQSDNVHDAMKRGRRKVTLTAELVMHFRAVRDSGRSVRAEAARLGISYTAAYQASAGSTWRHIK